MPRAIKVILAATPLLRFCIFYRGKGQVIAGIARSTIAMPLPAAEQAAAALPVKPGNGYFQDSACTAYTNRWYTGFAANHFRGAGHALLSIRCTRPASQVFSSVAPQRKKLSLFLPFPPGLISAPASQMPL